MKRTFPFTLLFFFFSGIGSLLYCQLINSISADTLIRKQLAIRHDNDFFTLTDRYYSSGLYISYTRTLGSGIFYEGKEQLQFTIGQEVYTPSNITTTSIAEQDRPYVGFTGLTSSWSIAYQKHAWEIDLLLGIAGNNSGAGGFQRWYHNVFVVSDPPIWVSEMNNSFHINTSASYRKEWNIAPNPFGITLAVQPKIAIGSRDQYAQGEVLAYFGRKDPLQNSMAFQRLGATNREVFFSIRAGIRHVMHNGLLEGNAFGDNSIFLIEPNTTLIFGGFDFQHRFGRNEYWVGYRIQGAEASGTEVHKYVILSYARNIF